MGDQEAVRVCDNCKREVSAANFVVHSAHCARRNIVVCDKCDCSFPSSEREEHAKIHAKIRCPTGCGRDIDQDDISAHTSRECSLRIVVCRYCEAEVPNSDLPDHEDYCGSRTEPCSGCGGYVMLKFTDIHMDSNHKFFTLENFEMMTPPTPAAIEPEVNISEERRAIVNGKRMNDMPQVNVCHDRQKNLNEKPSIPKTSDFATRKSAVKAPLVESMSEMTLEDLNFPKDYGGWYGSPIRPLVKTTPRRPEPVNDLVDVDRVVIPCEYCGLQYNDDMIIQHQTECAQSPFTAIVRPASSLPVPRRVPSPTIETVFHDDDDDDDDDDGDDDDDMEMKMAMANSLKEFRALPAVPVERHSAKGLNLTPVSGPKIRHVPIALTPASHRLRANDDDVVDAAELALRRLRELKEGQQQRLPLQNGSPARRHDYGARPKITQAQSVMRVAPGERRPVMASVLTRRHANPVLVPNNAATDVRGREPSDPSNHYSLLANRFLRNETPSFVQNNAATEVRTREPPDPRLHYTLLDARFLRNEKPSNNAQNKQ